MDLKTKRFWTIFYTDEVELWLTEMRSAFGYSKSLLPPVIKTDEMKRDLRLTEKDVSSEKFSTAVSFCKYKAEIDPDSYTGELCSLSTIRRHYASANSQVSLVHNRHVFWTSHSCSNCWKVQCQSCAEVKEEEGKDGIYWGNNVYAAAFISVHKDGNINEVRNQCLHSSTELNSSHLCCETTIDG